MSRPSRSPVYFEYEYRGIPIENRMRPPNQIEMRQHVWFHPVLDRMTNSWPFITEIFDSALEYVQYQRRRAGLGPLESFVGLPPNTVFNINSQLESLVNALYAEYLRIEAEELSRRNYTFDEIRDIVFKLRKPDDDENDWRQFLRHDRAPGAA